MRLAKEQVLLEPFDAKHASLVLLSQPAYRSRGAWTVERGEVELFGPRFSLGGAGRK